MSAWVEKDGSFWSKTFFSNNLIGLNYENNSIKCSLTGIEKSDGEAFFNEYKGTKKYFYDWYLILLWKGSLQGKDYTGTLKITNFSQDEDVKSIKLKTDFDDDPSPEFVQLLTKGEMATKIIAKLCEYSSKFQSDFISEKDGKVLIEEAKLSSVGVTESYTGTLDFRCSPEDLLRFFTDREMMGRFANGDVKFENEEVYFFGGSFSWKGNGGNGSDRVELKWRSGKWDSGYYSRVCLSVVDNRTYSELNIRHEGIPISFYDDVVNFWETFFKNCLNRNFGW